jgi:hypothetical protein
LLFWENVIYRENGPYKHTKNHVITSGGTKEAGGSSLHMLKSRLELFPLEKEEAKVELGYSQILRNVSLNSYKKIHRNLKFFQ